MINYSKNNQKGSVMIEALAMLGLIAMVTPMLYRKAAERTTELQDINIASQIRMVSAAVDSYLKDNYTNLAGRGDTFQIKGGDGATADEQADYNGVSAYLPEGFDLEHASKLFEGFEIAVRKDTATDLEGNTRNVFTSAVVANLKDDMTKVRAAKIASMIGTNGGMVSMEGESGDDYWLNGTQGTWRTKPNSFGFGDTPGWRDNSLVSISSEAISSSNGDVGSDEALFRVWKGESGFNTMETSLIFGGGNNVALEMRGHDINDVNALTVSGISRFYDDIYLEKDLIFRSQGGDINDVNTIRGYAGALGISGDTTITGALTATGDITSVGDIKGKDIKATNDISAGNDIFAEHDIKAKETVSGKKIEAGSGGIESKGNIVMTGDGTTNNILEIGLAKGSRAEFAEFEGQKLIIQDVTARTIGTGIINVSGIAGLSSMINMGGGNITNVGDIRMNSSSSTLDMNGGDITNVGTISGNTATFNNIIGTTIAASGITSSVGTFDDLHAKNYLTVGGETHNQGTVLEVETNSNGGTALFKTAQFGVGSGATAYDDNSNKIVIDSTNTFVGYNYGNNNGLLSNSGATSVAHDGFGMHVNGGGIAFGDIAYASSGYTLDASSDAALKDQTNVTAYISRDGAIELLTQSGKEDTTGFIRARRLVSDIPYTPSDWGGDGWSGDYSYYEVNPAYTSVMNDIKLASRGGARLSDILPDYINKGIYIADNTYGEGVVWTDSNGHGVAYTGITAQDCDDCATSPWLGYVPAPMCPPGYIQVITLEPIRWKMAEVYTFGNSNYNGSGNDLSNFDNVYWHPTGSDYANSEEPYKDRDKKAPYVTVNVTEAADGTHTATAELLGAPPVVLQTNTWLSTTIVADDNQGHGYDEAVTRGWHTIMGFLYPRNQYQDMYKRLNNGATPTDDMWNLFPVYPQELAAVARVYCSFLRHDNGNWTWGDNNSPVLKYDQLDDNSYTQSKDPDWVAQVNDSGHSSAW